MKIVLQLALIIGLSIFAINGFVLNEPNSSKSTKIKIESPAFNRNQIIPTKYTCDGENISPPLKWSNFPYRTVSFVIICDDPDAPGGNWVHWVIYNIPAKLQLNENIPNLERLPDGTMQGKNSWGKIGYGGPCPPSGTHKYIFKIYALDNFLDIPGGATKKEVLQAMNGKVIAKGELIGKYKRIK
jgi:hypothetical protein